jgi:hypothetical protein
MFRLMRIGLPLWDGTESRYAGSHRLASEPLMQKIVEVLCAESAQNLNNFLQEEVPQAQGPLRKATFGKLWV